VKLKREEWRARQPQLDPERLVFLDETWAATNMTRRYGRAPKGERLVCPTPHGHWKTTTFIAALSSSGLSAPMVLDGAMTGDWFVAYLEQILVPTLRVGQIVVMDNLQSHKRARVAEAIAEAGCEVWYLPPYSPDLNPIELAFSKLKSLLRREENRTIAALEAFLGRALEAFSPEECQRYMKHCGYPATPPTKML
jgi:transposase